MARTSYHVQQRPRPGWRLALAGEPAFTFTYDNGTELYYVPLDRCRTCAELLDWIFQLHGKGWMTPAQMHAFLSLVRDAIDPQRHMCTFGIGRQIDAVALARRTAA